ncbi:MAG: response regulator [Haloferacaceae archaeon]
MDDDRSFTQLVATFLERENDRFSVESATSAGEALDDLSAGEFDCIVSDYDMPGRNGIEFLQAVRKRRPDLPFVLFTGKGSEEVASEAISEGATDYLRKRTGTEQYELLANRVENAVEQYRSTRDAKRTRRRLQTLAESTSQCVWMFDRDWEELRFISGYEEVWDRSVEAIRENPRDFVNGVHPEDREITRDAMERMSNGESVRTEYRIRRGEGDPGWVCTNGEPVFDDEGTVKSVVGFTQDITEQKRRETRLRALHEAIERLVTADDEADILQITVDAAKEALGFPYVVIRRRNDDDELVPTRVSEEITEELGGRRPVYDVGEPTAGLAFSEQETIIYDDIMQLDDDIDRGDVRATMYLPIGRHGVVTIADDEPGGFDQSEVDLAEILIGHVETAFDLVARAQELERQNTRLERVVEAISHDLQSPLNVAVGKLRAVQDDAEDDRVGAAITAVERGIELADETLALARKESDKRGVESVELANVAEACWQTVETNGATYTVETDRRVRADRTLLQEMLENLVTNAVQHGGADVSVAVGDLENGFYVEDDGPGIDEGERAQVFDPGRTTATDGTGIGLAVVREIADVHGWEISTTSGTDGGARFEITDLERVDG